MNEKKIRRTEVTIETHSVTVIRIKGTQSSTHCECCQKPVNAFAPEQIAAILRLTLAEVCRRVETNELHLIEDQRGVALICGGSPNTSENERLQFKQ